MPQSRHRKTGKAKKRPKGTYPAAKAKPPAGRNRQARAIAIIVVVVIAASAIGYLISKRGGTSETLITNPSGLKYSDMTVGTGATPQRGQTVTVHYTGTLENGKKFDSSRDRGTPMEFKFGVQPMIKGWDEGLETMKVGGRRKLVVPPALGYGAQGRPPSIPGNSTLLFDIELLGVK